MRGDHELASAEVFPVERLAELPLLSPASESDDELLEFLERWGVRQNPHFTSWDDRAILSMVEHGLGFSILSELVLQGRRDNVRSLPLDPPACRRIGIAVPSLEALVAAGPKVD